MENDSRPTTTADDDDFSYCLVEEETHNKPASQRHVKPPLLLSPLSPVSGNEQRPVPSEGKDDDDEIKHAFLSTGSGLGTLWMRPEKMASLEEATLLSFEKLSMLDRHLPSSS